MAIGFFYSVRLTGSLEYLIISFLIRLCRMIGFSRGAYQVRVLAGMIDKVCCHLFIVVIRGDISSDYMPPLGRAHPQRQ